MKTWRNIIGSPVGKGLALTLVTTLLADIWMPSLALALTGGPSQPEFQGFSEIGVTDLVDPFTGDFHYEIPLMTVPGPNGGYPIHLNYMAGVGMEDEAGWVGLGWNLNPGAINRNMRGLPDDFSGPQEENGSTLVSKEEADKVIKSYFTKPNITVGLGMGITLPPQKLELAGADMAFTPGPQGVGLTPNTFLYYNSYKGVGFRAGIGMKLTTLTNESSSGGLSAGLNLNFDSNDGASAQPSISLSSGIGNGQLNISRGFDYNSRQGITNTFLRTSYSRRFYEKPKPEVKDLKYQTAGTGNGISFASTTGVPSTSVPMAGFNTGFNLDFEAGGLMSHLNIPISFNGMLSVQKVKDWMASGYAYPAYGTLYSGYRNNDDIQLDRALMDYNRENDQAINLKTPMLPMPVMTHDVYSVTGSGMGGSFRAFRNDVGVFYEPRVASDFLGVTLGVEVAAGSPGFKVGFDPTVNFSHSYSGKWKTEEDIDQLTSTNFFRKKSELTQNNIRTVEPFDFRFTGEMTAQTEGDNRFAGLGGNGPGAYTLFPATADFPNLSETEYEEPDAQEQMNKFFPFKNLGKFKAKASNKMNGKPIMATQTVHKYRERKAQLVQYRSKKEILAETGGGGEPLPSIIVSTPGSVLPAKTTFNLNQPEIKGHHITEFTVLKAGGMRYVYGLPLYNRKQDEFYFAIKKSDLAESDNSKIAEIPDLQHLINNQREGQRNDKLFTQTSIGPYAHAHLLTHIVSPDYVDVDNNGPSDNDYGYWTKFNYREIQSYKWRVPLEENHVNYIKGFASNPNDQKGTFTYGERDMTFLHSIETKTHVAVFYLSDRDDAQEVNGVTGGINRTSGKNKKLDKIVLYAKSAPGTPIKTVYFVYNYELCEGIPNRKPEASPYTHTVNGTTVTESYRGKLTLKKIYFEYGNSKRGALAPYVFEYGKVYRNQTEENSNGFTEVFTLDGNPDYKMMEVDRWGNYKKELPGGPRNADIPYVEQSTSTADRRLESATAWNLTGITLPTGSKIKIGYESDDYAYVQDKPATQMYRIAGMGTTADAGSVEWLDTDGKSGLTRNYNTVVFELDNQSATEADIAVMVNQIPDGKMYFKTWQRLQIPKGLSAVEWKPDYVTGYAPVNTDPQTNGILQRGATKYGYLTLKPVTEDSKNWNFFRKSGIQYLRYQRADLGMPQNQGDAALEAAAMILGVIPVIVQALEMISGFYNWSIAKNHCKFIMPGKPSVIKLGSADGIKYGGGHRVRRIVVSDAWQEMTGDSDEPAALYGMEYFYHTRDAEGNKISSGVASYEPLLGGDENPLKKPHYYGPDNKYVHNDPAFYLEEPIGESYFPAPTVGYSKVTSVNLANRKNRKTGDGIRVNEFYTAKDFPIVATYTVQPQRIEDKQTVFIPLMASITLKGYGYSQGYYIELNDMHGKPKAESLHDADYWNAQAGDWVPIQGEIPFVTKKTYHYKADGKRLNNTVDALYADNDVRSTVMGESSEMFSEMKEDFGYAISAGAQINGGVDPVPYAIFITGFPNFEYNENSARTLVTTKVVYKNGILEEVREMAEGAVKKTKNLLYDAETGQPLLTAVTSDYDNAQTESNDQYIYTYTYPAHWYYSGMQPAYKNYRNTYLFADSSSVFPNADRYFEPGDELVSANGHKLWVNSVSPVSVSFINSAGDLVKQRVNTPYVTVRSGKRNLQNVPAGSLESLKNPTDWQYRHAILDFYNRTVYNNPAYASPICPGNGAEITFEQLEDCSNPFLFYSGSISFSCGTPNYLMLTYQAVSLSGNKRCQYGFPLPSGFIPSKSKLSYVSPRTLRMDYTDPSGQLTSSEVNINESCLPLVPCVDDVLNATADEFSDAWSYDAEFNPPGGALATQNLYRKGMKGIWRKVRTNAYFAERKQRTGPGTNAFKTYIGRDGTYEGFTPFRWDEGNNLNRQFDYGWRWQAEVTSYGYSPYGYEIENRNALNIYSSELYGFGNSVVTASAQNAQYPEIAYESFEESAAGTYIPHGHLRYQTGGTGVNIVISSEDSHTGEQSLKMTGASGWIYLDVPVIAAGGSFSRTTDGRFQMIGSRKYVLSFWYKYANPGAPSMQYISKDVNASGPSAFLQNLFVPLSTPVEGWRRGEVIVDLGGSTTDRIYLELNPGNNRTVYFDDIRIHPADAPFKSFVYDPKNYLLRATLDDNNYATFYNYDEENTLIQVKKETEEGIRTIQTTRKHVNVLPRE